MSAAKSWTIHCDGCGEAGNFDLGDSTAAEARKTARYVSDYIRKRDGRDLCPGCQEADR